MNETKPETTRKGKGAGDNSTPAAAAWEAHCLLATTMDALTAIERKRKHPSQDVALGIEALSVVIGLIEADGRSHVANAAGPLKRVMVALHDMQAGKKPAIFSNLPPHVGNPTTRYQTEYAETWRRECMRS